MPDASWFAAARYGLFIHWGAYSVAGRGEWIMNRELIPADEYRRLYAENFRAEKYDPAAWAALAKRWGMQYAVLTTRHHDGFALWDSQVNPFNAARLGPGRDLVRPYVEAFRAAGLKVVLYYSPANWSHPDYP
ncbi:MAG: alpha-L-fucosidase, partial [Planctomycetes bacterium]|nr:alpha-L-fucosidase [Planctomycetota bacterium]